MKKTTFEANPKDAKLMSSRLLSQCEKHCHKENIMRDLFPFVVLNFFPQVASLAFVSTFHKIVDLVFLIIAQGQPLILTHCQKELTMCHCKYGLT